MVPSDESDDAGGFVPPLPAEDRLWRHPSEMAADVPREPGTTSSAGPHDTGTTTRRRGRRPVLVLSALAGLVVTLGVLAAVATFPRDHDDVDIERVAADPPQPSGDAGAPGAVGPALARIDAVRDGETVTTTAVVFRADGYLLTAADAVATATGLTATLTDGRVLTAALVGADASSGVAVVKVDATGLTTAVMGGDDDARPGADVVAVGHDPDAATVPIVAAARITGTGWRLDGADTTRHDMIRTAFGSVPVAEGGAVLCSEGGTVLGVILPDRAGTARPLPNPSGNAAPPTVLTTTADDGNDAHFATPISLAVRVADEIITTGRAHYPRLGVTGNDLDPSDIATPGRSGALLTGIEPGGPAEQGGLRAGDLITAVDQQAVRSISELVVALRERRPGDDVTLSYRRGEESRRTTVTLADSPG